MSRRKKGSKRSDKTAPPPSRRPSLWLATVAVVLLGTLGFWMWSGAKDTRPWNLVLVSVDTLRADHVSAYGEGGATPNIDPPSSANVPDGMDWSE